MVTINDDWLGLLDAVCVVTGAGSGIGRATCLELAQAGAKVAALDLSEDSATEIAELLRNAGTDAIAVQCDVSDRGSVRAAAQRAMTRFGRFDVLVNNAGLVRPSPLEIVSVADWDLTFKVNVTGTLICAQEFGRDMLARGSGSMVHTASIGGSQPQPFNGAYSASKSAVIMLSRQLALEWGSRGVRSNVVSPGLVRTAMTEAIYQQPGVTEARQAVVPTRRIANPQDIAQTIVYLASRLSSYVTGQEIVADGGLSQTLMSHIPRVGHTHPVPGQPERTDEGAR